MHTVRVLHYFCAKANLKSTHVRYLKVPTLGVNLRTALEMIPIQYTAAIYFDTK